MANFTIPANVISIGPVVPTGNVTFGASTTPPTPGPGEDACTNCPDYISAPVEEIVSRALNQVRAIKKRSTQVSAALAGKVSGVIAGMTSAVGNIPVPPVFDISEILDTFTCPLTPVAIALDPSLLVQFDIRTIWKKLQDTFRDHLRRLVAAYEADLAALAGFDLVRLAKDYYEDLKRMELDVSAFAKATAISVYVLGVCPITHAAGVYAEYDAEILDFDLSGFVPILSLDPDVSSLILVLESGEAKLEAWRIAATQPPIF